MSRVKSNQQHEKLAGAMDEDGLVCNTLGLVQRISKLKLEERNKQRHREDKERDGRPTKMIC